VYRRFLSQRYLRSRFVNFISVAAVTAGIAVMIVVTAVMDGFQVKVKEVLRGTLSHLVMTPDGSVQPPAFDDLEKKLLENRDVVGAAPQLHSYVAHPYQASSWDRAKTEFHLLEVVGIDWEREKKVSRLAEYLREGNPKDPFTVATDPAHQGFWKTGMFGRSFLQDFIARDPETGSWLGKTVEVWTLGRKVDRSGQPIQGDEGVRKSSYQIQVASVYDAEDQTQDRTRFYVPIETLREIGRVDTEYTEVLVKVKDYDEASRVKREILATVPGFQVQTWEEVRANYLRAINNEKVLLQIVLSFIVLLAGFTILATLTLTVVEKTRDIGLLKAVGATTGGVLSLFLRSGLLIGVIGGVLGLGLGLLVTHHVNTIKDALASIGIQIFPPDIYLFREIPTNLDVWGIAFIVLGGVLVAFLAGLPPALRAARMDPVVALRHE
jgi:lipoprotein-releasing system permease protein